MFMEKKLFYVHAGVCAFIAQAMLSYSMRGLAVYFCVVTWSYLKVDKLTGSHAFLF